MAALAQTTIQQLDRTWAAYFGCSPATLAAPGVQVLPHVGLGDFRGLFIFARGEGQIVSVPPASLPGLSAALMRLSAADLVEPTRLQDLLGGSAEQIIGPTYHGYADTGTLRPQVSESVRLLGESDAAALATLRAACDPEEWAHGGVVLGQEPVIGVFVVASLVAAASYRIWQGEHANIAIVTHPSSRGRGYGRIAVWAIAEQATKAKLLPGYRTLLSNTPSLAIASGVGFVPYATSITIRLML